METLKAVLKNRDKPIFPFVVLGVLSVAALWSVLKNWGEYRYQDVEAGSLEIVASAAFLIYWIREAWKYSESYFRTPLAVLLGVTVMYDVWQYWTLSGALYGLSTLAVELCWVGAVATLYFDTVTVAPPAAWFDEQ